MHVRKFEADTMDEALKAIKYELGPDAIIIKTITNNGLKSAFKKKKIEITAAISEEDFNKKRKVDKVLSDDQKKELYSKPSYSINEVINQYNEKPASSLQNASKASAASGYGKMGLNKSVKKTSNDTIAEEIFDNADHELDSFLSKDASNASQISQADDFSMAKFHQDDLRLKVSANNSETSDYWSLKQQVEEQNNHLSRMKEEMDMLRAKLEDLNGINPDGSSDLLKQMLVTLKTFDMDHGLLRSIMQTVRDGFHEEITEDELWTIAIEKIKSILRIKTLSVFSEEGIQTVTVFVSEGASGQTSLIYKIANKLKRPKIICYAAINELSNHDKHLESLVGVEVHYVNKPSDLITAIKDALAEGCTPLVDLKIRGQDYLNIKTMFTSLRKSFMKLEVVGCLSSIHAEIYNKKFLHQTHRDLDVVVYTHTDLCINWVTMLNVQNSYAQVPMALISTGPTIPGDISEVKVEEFIKNMFGI